MADKLDPVALAVLLFANGVTNLNDIVTAITIAQRESGLNPSSHNTNANTGDNSYGIFQINLLDPKSPDKLDHARMQAFGITDPNQLLNPVTNVRAFATLYKQSGFQAWGPYKGVSPTHNTTPEQAQIAAQAVSTAQSKGWLTPSGAAAQAATIADIWSKMTGIADSTSTVSDAASSVLGGWQAIIDLLGRTLFSGNWWKWVGIGALGVLLVLIAVQQSKTGQDIAQSTAQVAGSVAKGVA